MIEHKEPAVLSLSWSLNLCIAIITSLLIGLSTLYTRGVSRENQQLKEVIEVRLLTIERDISSVKQGVETQNSLNQSRIERMAVLEQQVRLLVQRYEKSDR